MDEILSIVAGRWVGDRISLFLLAGLAVAAILFCVRKFLRGIYGLIEVVAGLMLLYSSYKVTPGSFSRDFSNDFETFRVAVTFTATLGGLFAIVRGLDNIDVWWKARAKKNVPVAG